MRLMFTYLILLFSLFFIPMGWIRWIKNIDPYDGGDWALVIIVGGSVTITYLFIMGGLVGGLMGIIS